MKTVLDSFKITNRVTVITGGAGLLGKKHAEAIIEGGGLPILLDINQAVEKYASHLSKKYHVKCQGIICNITNKHEIENAYRKIIADYSKIDILINNAANNPKVEDDNTTWCRFENLPINVWNNDIAVGLTGAFLTSQVFGNEMAKRKKGGVILNIASDLSVIAPDQRIYRKEKLLTHEQPVKPVTYSVVKHSIIGLTKYLATYWADAQIRVNALSPGGVYNNQDQNFVQKLSYHIPLGRMANKDEYKAALLFLVSDASSYMTGANIIIDGGRSVW